MVYYSKNIKNIYSSFTLKAIIKLKLFPLDYVHTVSFSLAFYIVLRPQGIRKQMKTTPCAHSLRTRIEYLKPKAIYIKFVVVSTSDYKVYEPRSHAKVAIYEKGLYPNVDTTTNFM